MANNCKRVQKMCLVAMTGVEPVRFFSKRRILSPLRLPVPSHGPSKKELDCNDNNFVVNDLAIKKYFIECCKLNRKKHRRKSCLYF